MPQRIEAFKQSLLDVCTSGSTVLASAASTIALSEQLSRQRPFLDLSLPLWLLYLIIIGWAFFGALVTLWADLMKHDSLPKKLFNLFIGFMAGVMGAFVILPNFTSAPTHGLMMFTATIFGFTGTILLRNLAEALSSDEFKKLFSQGLIGLIATVFDTLKGLIPSFLNKKRGDK